MDGTPSCRAMRNRAHRFCRGVPADYWPGEELAPGKVRVGVRVFPRSGSCAKRSAAAMTTTTGLGGGGHDGRRAHRFTSGLRRTPFSAGLMSTLQPVSLAARRAFWPFRPITKESWSLGTRTCAVSVVAVDDYRDHRGPRGASIRPLRREGEDPPSLGLPILASVTAPVGDQQPSCAGFRTRDSGRQISG